MSRTLKWILGVVGVLIVLAVVAAGVWVWQSRVQLAANTAPYAAQPRLPGGQSQQPFQYGPRGFNNDGRNPMGGRGFPGPMMRGFSRPGRVAPFALGFFFLASLFRVLLPLAVLVVVAIIFYQLGRRANGAAARQESRPANPPAGSNQAGS